ncbi:PREDICTED: caspase recruitment domain-containing protein 18 [Rhinopithecus bieti]|uniref:caspase recruitment domain-containing protein 18 n=1 Tax=Rhinopithecus bieti TaxID=61621 RepID=UPI00083C4DB6|nr:PREDICTED: caspase recruitment domain-containing protein 18 [Rhinopithecus bieti]
MDQSVLTEIKCPQCYLLADLLSEEGIYGIFGLPTDQLLRKKRRIFIHSLGAGTINALLDYLLEDEIISQENMNKVRDENDTVMDKARVLIDLVIGKGSKSCLKFIKHLCEEDSQLAAKMGLHKGEVE